MNKAILQNYLKEEPSNAKAKYIFLIDDKNAALAIINVEFKAVALIKEEGFFDVEGLISSLKEKSFSGTCMSDYIYVTACKTKKANDRLKEYFKMERLQFREDGWKLFRQKEYLFKLEPASEQELKTILDNFVRRYEGNNIENSIEETVESATTEVSRVSNMLSYKIIYDKDGNEKDRKILQTVRNFEIILEKDRRFAGKIKFNEFSKGIYIIGDVPWQANNNREWDNFDDSALFSILQSDYGMNNRNDYFDAIKNIGMRNRFHPVRELLDSLKWDGKEHIRRLLPDYLGAEDSEYSYQVMRLQMVGAVKRIFEPACKFDYTVIYTGRQGLGKSTFLRKLALKDQWFNDSLDSLDSDKAAQSLMGSWIIELAELKSLTRTTGGIDSVKRFLSATQDKFRLPYERRTDIFLRQCIFCGTTNRSDFLQDETGNRRFLIIQTGINEPKKSLFSPEATQDIEAAWAEAVHIYKTENPQLILPDSCKEEAQRLQESSMADDGKAGIIAEYLEDKQRICVLELWQKALGEQGRPQKWQASEIINIILSLPEWERMKSPSRFGEYGQQKGFKKMSTKLSTKSSESCLPSNKRVDGFTPISAESQMELPFD